MNVKLKNTKCGKKKKKYTFETCELIRQNLSFKTLTYRNGIHN